MKEFVIYFCTFLSFFAASHSSACDFNLKELDLCGKVEFIQKPNLKKSSDFKLTFYNLKKKIKVIPDYKIMIYLWMKMPGREEHGSDNVKIELKKDHYFVQNVWFLMEGDWHINIQLRDKGKIISKAQKAYCISGKKYKCN